MALRTLEKRIRVREPGTQWGYEKFRTEYYLLESEADNDDAANNRTIYSIEIVKKTDGGCVGKQQVRRYIHGQVPGPGN